MSSVEPYDCDSARRLEALNVSAIARGTGAPLSIPIDDETKRKAVRIAADHPAAGICIVGAWTGMGERREPSVGTQAHPYT